MASSATVAPLRAPEAVQAILPPWTHYSPTKLLRLDAYCATVSRWHVAMTLLLTPIPALIGSLLPSFVPLAHPLRGFEANCLVLAHVFITVFLVAFGTILLTLGAVATPREQYSEVYASIVSLMTTSGYIAIVFLICHYWTFNMPFMLLTMLPAWIIIITIVHTIMLWDRFRRFPLLKVSLAQYRAPFALQFAQFLVYSGLTVMFDHLSTTYQIALIAVFPLVKLYSNDGFVYTPLYLLK